MDHTAPFFAEPVLRLGAYTLTLGAALAAGALALCLLIIAMGIGLWRAALARAEAAAESANRSRELEDAMSGILRAQSEMQGRLGTVAEIFGTRQHEMTQSLNQRLDAMTGRIGQTMTEQTRSTHESLSRLQERLAVIDTAQNNIQSLAGQVVQLQAILSNKQTRGAFGQSRMEAIVSDQLPKGSYEFQATLSNNSRPDCLVLMPNDTPKLAIDAKFPLEAWNAIRAADGADAQRVAAQAFRRDLDVHIRDIAEKYLIPGETQETAFMFVPSEAIFAEIHENFEAIVQRAQRSRIVIVSPSLLMLSVQLIQSIMKDARMREQAHLIQSEVRRLMEDVGRLDERTQKLKNHFNLATRDIEDILTSSAKVTRRGRSIDEMEFAVPGSDAARIEAAGEQPRRVADSKTGQLRLRVIETDE